MNLQASHPGLIDLHCHSTFSDGRLTPTELVERAKQAGVGTLSLTDHDSVDGIPEAIEAGGTAGIQIVPGVELTAYRDDHEIHVLGYFIDVDNVELRSYLKRFRERRRERLIQMAENLRDEGIVLEPESFLLGEDIVAGRPHLARALLDAGYASSIKEAFHQYIGVECPAYVPKLEIRSSEVFDLVRRAGGLSILAHPGKRYSREFLGALRAEGLDGVEVYHGEQSREATRWIRRYAEARGLLLSGGSDFHGVEVKPHVQLAQACLPREHFEELLTAAAERRRGLEPSR